MTIGVANTLW